MATGHMMTNRGKLLFAQGYWNLGAAGATRIGLLQTQHHQTDTVAEVADLNTVADLLAHSNEGTFTNYTRKTLSRSNATEDDANDRVNFVAAPVTWTAAGGVVNNTIYGAFIYDATTDTNDSTRILISVDWFVVPVATNGGDLIYTPSTFYTLS